MGGHEGAALANRVIALIIETPACSLVLSTL